MSTPEQRAKLLAVAWDIADTREPPTRFGTQARHFIPSPWLAWAFNKIRKGRHT